MTVGERIKNRRKELGMTQQELADRLGYTNKSSIGKVENSNCDITQKRLAEFAEALFTTTAFLMGWEHDVEYTVPLTEDEIMLVEFYRCSDELTRSLVRRALHLD